MDIVKDKQKKQYDYISRYTPFSYYYNIVDEKYFYGLTKQLDTNVPYVLHKVLQSDTLDSLAYKYYGRPDLFWIIASYNHINDAFTSLSENYSYIKVPALSSVKYKK